MLSKSRTVYFELALNVGCENVWIVRQQSTAGGRVGACHVWRVVPAVAVKQRSNIIFSPNGMPPRDARAVAYFQDLYHFQLLNPSDTSMREQIGNVVRAIWRTIAIPTCLLAVAVSRHIEREVARRASIPVRLISNGVDVGSARWSALVGEASKHFDKIFSAIRSSSMLSFGGSVINRDHFEPGWPTAHVRFFASRSVSMRGAA